MNRRTQLLALAVVIFISGTSALYWYLDTLDTDIPDDDNNGTAPPGVVATIEMDLTILETSDYRGNNYDAELEILTDVNVTLNTYILTIRDHFYNRLGEQNITISQTIGEGTTIIPISIEPAFPGNEGVVISEPNQPYSLLNSSLIYNTTSQFIISESLNVDLTAIESPEYNQASVFDWSIDEGASVVSANKGDILISGDSNPTTEFSLTTEINATGYPRITIFEDFSNLLDDVDYFINGSLKFIENNLYLPIGNQFGVMNFTITGSVSDSETIELTINMRTRDVVLFAVIADNNFSAPSGENFDFREPDFYVEQMSYQFERVLNVTIIPAITVDVNSPSNSTLFNFATETLETVGEDLNLGQSEWVLSQGSAEENDGYDILLIFTNETMDNLGIVYGDLGGAFNLAIHARGSLNTGNYRLPPSFADNLIQHEVSHIFGAPDRYTDTSPPSVMTKSHPEDAFNDLIFSEFWLMQIHWLEDDIQTMSDRNRILYW